LPTLGRPTIATFRDMLYLVRREALAGSGAFVRGGVTCCY
jgi:hypothetical protein